VLLDREALLLVVVNLLRSKQAEWTYNRSTDNPVEISLGRLRDKVMEERTTLHSVFVSRLYFPGRLFLHLLQTRQPNVFLKSWSISIDLHSLHFGFIFGSSDISFYTSVHPGNRVQQMGTYEVPGYASLVPSRAASPLLSSSRRLPCHPQPRNLPWCSPSLRGHNHSICPA